MDPPTPSPVEPMPPWVVTIASSAGGLHALTTILSALPRDLPAAVVVVQHRTPAGTNLLPQILSRSTPLRVVDAKDGQAIEPSVVYIARPDLHLTVSPERRFSYIDGRRIRFLLSSANPLFESAATAFPNRVVAVVLTGSGFDATDGVQTVKAHGGLVIAQDPATAAHRSMPASAVSTGAVDFVLPLESIAPALNALVHGQAYRPAGTAAI